MLFCNDASFYVVKEKRLMSIILLGICLYNDNTRLFETRIITTRELSRIMTLKNTSVIVGTN